MFIERNMQQTHFSGAHRPPLQLQHSAICSYPGEFEPQHLPNKRKWLKIKVSL